MTYIKGISVICTPNSLPYSWQGKKVKKKQVGWKFTTCYILITAAKTVSDSRTVVSLPVFKRFLKI